jgi:hypothetical protein
VSTASLNDKATVDAVLYSIVIGEEQQDDHHRLGTILSMV